jgi:hypothetical protein
VESVPRDVEVYLGEEKLGVAPGPFPVERGNEPIELELRAKGYVSRKVQFTPKANGVVSATLQKIVRKTRGGAKKPELEF